MRVISVRKLYQSLGEFPNRGMAELVEANDTGHDVWQVIVQEPIFVEDILYDMPNMDLFVMIDR